MAPLFLESLFPKCLQDMYMKGMMLLCLLNEFQKHLWLLSQARDKLSFLTEILKIGSDIVHSELGMSPEDVFQSLPTEGGEAEILSSVISDEDKMDKQN